MTGLNTAVLMVTFIGLFSNQVSTTTTDAWTQTTTWNSSTDTTTTGSTSTNSTDDTSASTTFWSSTWFWQSTTTQTPWNDTASTESSTTAPVSTTTTDAWTQTTTWNSSTDTTTTGSTSTNSTDDTSASTTFWSSTWFWQSTTTQTPWNDTASTEASTTTPVSTTTTDAWTQTTTWNGSTDTTTTESTPTNSTDDTTASTIFWSSNSSWQSTTPTTAPGNRPSVSATLEEVQPGPKYKTIISCDFEPSDNPNMLYVVHWFRDGQLHYNTSVARYADRDQFLIREEDFVSGRFYMGNTLSCAVTTFGEENGPAVNSSETSQDFFVGIRILTPSLTFASTDDESKRTIRLQPTVPIGCQGTTNCSLQLTAYLPKRPIKEECQGLGFAHSTCGTLIHSESYGDVVEVVLVVNDPGQPRQDADDHYEVYIKTEPTEENEIWGDYHLPTIPVTITSTGSGTIVRGRCSAVNDPHWTTFDGRWFDDHSEGTKIMYRNTVYQTEVQIFAKSCGYWFSPAYCVRGIAVRAGFDVYVINVYETFEDGYRFCHGNSRSLTVRKINYSQTKIELPYGTYVIVDRSYSSLRAYVYPSSHDKENTEGLCGTLDENRNNDFHMRDGTIMSQDYHQQHPSRWNPYNMPDEFIDEWRVQSDTEDLFSDNFSPSNLRPSSDNICICEDDAVSKATLMPSVPCKANGAAVCKAQQGGSILGAKHCQDITGAGRRRRSVKRRSSATVPEADIQNVLPEHTRTKRAVPDTNDWTEEEAEQFCATTFQGQQTYNLCDQIPSVDTQSSIDVCSTDIPLTNGTDWVADSVDGMVSGCNEELVRNLTLVRAAAAGDPLQDTIKAISCPNNCSGSGVCDGGVCTCDEGAGASDCSVDLTIAVHVSSLLDGGLCNRALEQCEGVSVFGGMFVDGEDLLCQLQEFTETESGQRIYGSVYTVLALFETFIEVECPISGMRKRRAADDGTGDNSAVVTGYSIAVTNNAALYSERKDLFVYDSQCQTFQEDGDNITFSLIDGNCFIDNACVTAGQVSVVDECHVCQPQNATRSWSRDVSKDGCEPLVGPVEDAGNGNLDTVSIIVGAAVGGVVVAIIIAAIIGVAIVKANRSKNVVGSSVTLDKP